MKSSDAMLTDEFLDAIKAGDSQRVESLVRSHPELLESRTGDGLDPVVLAKYYGRDGVAELLLARGVEVDVFGAAMMGRADQVRHALSDDPDMVGLYSPDGWTLLHLAAHFGQLEVVQMLTSAGADVNARSRNNQGNTPLHAALPGGHLDIVRLLVHAGADVNATQEGDATPLHEAALIGSSPLTLLLLEGGASIDARTAQGETALMLAQRSGHEGVAALLLERGASS
jgi:ankyrin repeat protein